MSNRLTKIYTRTGDDGYTSLNDSRLPKDDLLVEAVGTVDELNSFIGWIISHPIQHPEIKVELKKIQHQLFDMGGEFHLPDRIAIQATDVTRLEETLDRWNSTLPPLKDFVLPGGNAASSACHIARTVCRRAERCVVKLHRQVMMENKEIMRYLNRLSDLLFVTARMLAKESNELETLWEHRESDRNKTK